MTPSPPHADVRGSDLVIAAVLTATVLGGSVLALAHARLDHEAELPVIDPGVAIPIAVRPVADVPSGGATKGGGRQKKGQRAPSRPPAEASPAEAPAEASVPQAWRRQSPSPRDLLPTAPTLLDAPWPPHAEPDEATPETDTPEPTTTQDEAELADVTHDPVDDAALAEQSPPDESGGSPAGDANADVDAQEGSQTGDGGEDSGGGEAEAGGGGGGQDPLLERAIAFYRARLVAWFSARFRVTGSGLSPAELAKHRVRVHIEVGEDLRIVDYRILSSDHPAFDSAARTMLDKLRGESLPPPPENYPGAVQRQLTVTFTCAEDTCD